MGDIVNSFWHGSPLGLMQRLTIQSYLDHGHPFHLWAYDLDMDVPSGTIVRDAREIYGEAEVFRLIGGFHDGSYAFFADQFLMKLLPQAGGWWVGMDAVALRPLPEVGPYLFGPHHTAGMGTHVLKVPQGDPVLTDALSSYRSVFRLDDYDYHAGLRLIYDSICKHGLKHTVGSAEHWGDDSVQYDLHFQVNSDRPGPDRVLYHFCHSVTKWQEENPLRGSFYRELLLKHRVIDE